MRVPAELPVPDTDPDSSRRRSRAGRVVRWSLLFVVGAVVAFLAGGLARGLFFGHGPQLVALAGEVTVNGQPVTEPITLGVDDVVGVIAGQGDVFLSEDRWLRLTPDAEVSLTGDESIEHRGGTGWYRAAGEVPVSIKVGGVDVLVEGAVLVVDDEIIVADGAAEVDGTRLTAGEAVVDGQVVGLAPDQVYADPWVARHLDADHRFEVLAERSHPAADSTLLGEYRAELRVISSEFTDEPGTSMERDADIILRCDARPCTMVLRLARSGGRVDLPLSWTGTGYTAAISTSWPCLTNQRLVGDNVYQVDLELELDSEGVGTLGLDLSESSQPEVCHPGTVSFVLILGGRR